MLVKIPTGKEAITCKDCGGKEKHCAKGLCQRCYNRRKWPQWYQKHKRERSVYVHQWLKENPGKVRIRSARRLQMQRGYRGLGLKAES